MITNLETLSRLVTANNFRKNSLIVNYSVTWFVAKSKVDESENGRSTDQIRYRLRDFWIEVKSGRSSRISWPSSFTPIMIRTIQCPSLSDRQNLRHAQTSQSHFENALRVGHLVGVWKEYYRPMPRNLLLWHYPKDEVQLELLKINVICVKNWTTNIKIVPKIEHDS